MSDEDRERLLGEFWAEVTDGLTGHPAFAEHLHRLVEVEAAGRCTARATASEAC
ncbi:hypothetical protein AB0A63_31060 [Lentzea sp. NPDC042327]|uniref:hypothetical protein n=1 Tax=Lentzea sp. NPDC042327 TaxID=3154801 RepID=UPI0033C872AB